MKYINNITREGRETETLSAVNGAFLLLATSHRNTWIGNVLHIFIRNGSLLFRWGGVGMEMLGVVVSGNCMKNGNSRKRLFPVAFMNIFKGN